MINLYNWSYEVDKNLVRIVFYSPIKNKLLFAIKRFNGQIMPIKLEPNELIVKFKNTKVIDDFINFIFEQCPNSFNLNNDWEISKHSEHKLSFTAVETGSMIISDLSKIINSFFTDCEIISSLSKNELIDIQLSAEPTLCYITFNINFKSDSEAQEFLDDFLNFKA